MRTMPATTRGSRTRQRAARVTASALLLVVGLAGCSGLLKRTARGDAIAPSGLDVWEDALRRSLAEGRFEQAWRRSASEKDGGPGDRLLRALYAGAAAHYAGRYAESAQALDRAAQIADDRFTRSASRGALALVTNDRALAYVPGQTERAMVHYYALLDYLKQDDATGAAVEARRLSALLQRFDEGGHDPLDASTRAVLRYLAGVAFEASGNAGDAGVAYRNARKLLDETRLPAGAHLWPDSIDPGTPDSAFGDVVVVVEQGFVAHRVDQSLFVRLGDADSRRISTGGEQDVERIVARIVSTLTGEADGALYANRPLPVIALVDTGTADSSGSVVRGAMRTPAVTPTSTGGSVLGGSVPDELLRGAAAARMGTARRPGSQPGAVRPRATSKDAPPPVPASPVHVEPAVEPAEAVAAAVERPRRSDALLKLSWPAYRRPAAAFSRVTIGTAADSTAMPVGLRGDLSDAVVADFKRDRARLLARLVVRAAARHALTQQLGQKHSELGDIISSVAGSVLERADTRSWHLLPGTISVVRLRLPVGRHTVRVTREADAGGATRDIGEVEVRAGAVAVMSTRLWRGDARRGATGDQ
jgi:hypothetical protein